jgi:hypothetical protein
MKHINQKYSLAMTFNDVSFPFLSFLPKRERAQAAIR